MNRSSAAVVLAGLAALSGLGLGPRPMGALALRSAGVSGPQETPAQGPTGMGREGKALRVYLITAGRGDAVWEQFGHNALWIQDTSSDWSMAFNWGIFSFDQVGFIPRLARGTMLYSMHPADPDEFVAGYRSQDRRVWIQELHLSPEQKAELREFVLWNARPENRDYRYDYYRDNCSTRIRDALDRVLDGRLKAAFDSVSTGSTYRWHTRRLLGDLPPYYLGIQTVLGPRADVPLSAWEEMFLPVKLMGWIRDLEVPDDEGVMGPLVLSEQLLFDSRTRDLEPQRPPLSFPWFLAIGLAWGGLLAILASGKGALRGTRRLALSLLGGGWAVLSGFAGTLLVAAWLFTDHFFWYRNFNLFQLNPLGLVLAVGFLGLLFRGRLPTWAGRLAGFLAAMSVLGLLVQLLPGLGQENAEFLALALPVNLAVAWAGHRWRKNMSPIVPGSG